MILDDVIIEVRRIIQDTNIPYRYSDDVLLGFANQALKRIAVLFSLPQPILYALLKYTL
jgi:hypothetical protein